MQLLLSLPFGLCLIVCLAHICLSSPVQPLSVPAAGRLSGSQSTHLSANPPECFTLTLAPPLALKQCNDQLEWFYERQYEHVNFVGANAPYTYTRPPTSNKHCFVSIVSDDLFVTDRFTYGDLVKFAVWILRTCTDGTVMSGKGGRVKMVDRAGGWGGFWLRVDGWNPFPSNMARNNGSVLTAEAALT